MRRFLSTSIKPRDPEIAYYMTRDAKQDHECEEDFEDRIFMRRLFTGLGFGILIAGIWNKDRLEKKRIAKEKQEYMDSLLRAMKELEEQIAEFEFKTGKRYRN